MVPICNWMHIFKSISKISKTSLYSRPPSPTVDYSRGLLSSSPYEALPQTLYWIIYKIVRSTNRNYHKETKSLYSLNGEIVGHAAPRSIFSKAQVKLLKHLFPDHPPNLKINSRGEYRNIPLELSLWSFTPNHIRILLFFTVRSTSRDYL